MNPHVRLLIADDEDLFREGLALLFGRDPEFRVVGQARTGEEARDKARRLQPDLALIELHLPGMSGLDVARAMAAELPQARVALIARSFSKTELFEAVRHGVRGYITKDIQLDTLVEAMRQVARGEFFLPQASMAMLMEGLATSGSGASASHDAVDRAKVTEREREVLQLLVHGATNRDIAERLQITENTVKVHLRNILDKLQLRNRQQAAAFAISSGLVHLQRDASVHTERRTNPSPWGARHGA